MILIALIGSPVLQLLRRASRKAAFDAPKVFIEVH
jgi:hypothetical protein